MAKRCMGCMKTYGDQYEVCPHCGYVEGTPPREAYHMKPGTVLHGKYIVGKVVGYGGFGVTYVAWDNVLQQKVAIKEYLPSEFATRVPGEDNVTIYSGEKEVQFGVGREKFSDEARRLAQFGHVPGVVAIRDTFQDNRTAYIVMEFLEGETLKERIEREKQIPPEEALDITKAMLLALEQVHKAEIIHRDIAPDNVFLCSDGSVKLLDFGASRYATVQHSKSLSIILKEGYAPEEQYRSKGEQGPWSDVYAVGATLYKMLTGVTPEDAMERAENDKLKPVSKYGVKLSKGVETALMNALNVFAEDRTQSAEEFLEELDAATVTRKARTRKKIDLGKWPLWSKIAVAFLAVGLTASGFLLSQQSLYALEDGKSYVPEVINMDDEKAQKTAEKNDLALKIVGQEKSDKVELARVMTQYPDAGRVVNTGEMVEVKISAGNEVQMIDLTGMTQEEAMEILNTLGFNNIEFVTEASAAPQGTILRQSIEANTTTAAGGKIKIVVSSGLAHVDESKDTTVPDLTGMSYEEAARKAGDAHLYIVKGSMRAASAPAGTVIEQSVKAGSKCKEGTTITLTISTGEQTVEVPYVEYMTEDEAQRLLEAYGLRSSVRRVQSDTVSSGLVMSQSVSAGEKVKYGTKVSLTVSKGSGRATVPNVKGMEYGEAVSALQSKGFRYVATYRQSTSVAKGKVISYDPSGTQTKGTKITLTISEGKPAESAESKPSKPAESKPSKPAEPTVTTVQVPDVAGKQYTDAISILQEKGFRYAVQYVHNENIDWGRVTAVSPSGKQKEGTKITLTVSKGTAGKYVSEDTYYAHYWDESKYTAGLETSYRYRTREKEYTTSGYSSISSNNGNAWQKYDTKTSTSTSSWTTSSSTGTTTSSSGKVTKSIAERGYYYAGYSAKKGDRILWVVTAVYDKAGLKSWLQERYSSKSVWSDSNLYYLWQISTTKASTYKGKVYFLKDEPSTKTFTLRSDGWRTLNSGQYLGYLCNVYKIKTTTTVNYFWRYGSWSAWSSWSATPRSGSENTEVQMDKRYYVVGKAPN